MTQVYYYQERENSLLEGQNQIFLPALKNWRKLLSPLVLVFLLRHLCSKKYHKKMYNNFQTISKYYKSSQFSKLYPKTRT
jgi:hypothetical protein